MKKIKPIHKSKRSKIQTKKVEEQSVVVFNDTIFKKLETAQKVAESRISLVRARNSTKNNGDEHDPAASPATPTGSARTRSDDPTQRSAGFEKIDFTSKILNEFVFFCS